MGSIISHISDFYSNPRDVYTGASVTLSSPLPTKQCTFTIASNEKAKGLSSFLPNKDDDDLIGIMFNCSAESREEYFPVIYRQG